MRARAELRVGAFFADNLARRVGERDVNAALGQTFAQTFELNFDDAAQLFALQRVEHDHFVNAICRLRAEVRAQSFKHAIFEREIARLGFGDEVRGEVARHDYHAVFEAHHAALAVGEVAIVEQL